MWICLRILFGILTYLAFQEVHRNAVADPTSGDLTNAFWTAVLVVLGLANGIVWAPFLGEKISDPLTGGTIDSEHVIEPSSALKAIRWFDKRHCRFLVRWLCFIEAVRKPWLPYAYAMGLANTVEGSWLEKVYAREVFKFNNVQNCLKAFTALKRHGIDPRPHHTPTVNLSITSLEHEIKDAPALLGVPQAPPPPAVKRNKRIQLGPD